jgi:hypothetical protein
MTGIMAERDPNMRRCTHGGVMDNRGQWGRRVYFYQLRSQLGEDPFEILTRLTHRVWVALDKNGGHAPLDPHVWPGLFQTFRDIFLSRLSFSPQCGRGEGCLSAPCVLCGERPHTHDELKRVHILQTRQPLDRFMDAVSAALVRRLRTRGVALFAQGKNARRQVRESLVDVLKDHLFMREACRYCPARVMGPGERRQYPRDILGYSWGGLRRIRPGDHPRVEELEEA